MIVPSVNNVMEPEFNAMKPEGISIYATRLLLTEGTVEGLKKMSEGVEEAARLIADAGVTVIAYGCTSGSLIKGVGWDKKLISTIERITAIPATTTSTAVMEVFKKLGVSKVAVATPYPDEVNQLERKFFEDQGINVVSMKGLGITKKEDMQNTLPETAYKLACEVDTPEAEAVFISCTGFKSLTVIEELEKVLGKYVFSSNTATMWEVLNRLGISNQVRNYGKLFLI